jgi:hypothetical protein
MNFTYHAPAELIRIRSYASAVGARRSPRGAPARDHQLVGHRLALDYSPDSKHASGFQGVRVVQRDQLGGIPKRCLVTVGASVAHLHQCLHMLGVPLAGGTVELVGLAPSLKYVRHAVMLQVGIELLGLECDYQGAQ